MRSRRPCMRVFVLAFVGLTGACAAPDIEPTVRDDRLEFALQDLDGNLVSSDDPMLRNKVVLVDIWGSWCPPCLEAHPFFEDLLNEFESQGLVILAVAFEDEPDQVARRQYLQEFVHEHDVAYRILDGGTPDQLANRFPTLEGFQGFPTVVIIGRDGMVAHANTLFVPVELDEIRDVVEREIARTGNSLAERDFRFGPVRVRRVLHNRNDEPEGSLP